MAMSNSDGIRSANSDRYMARPVLPFVIRTMAAWCSGRIRRTERSPPSRPSQPQTWRPATSNLAHPRHHASSQPWIETSEWTARNRGERRVLEVQRGEPEQVRDRRNDRRTRWAVRAGDRRLDGHGSVRPDLVSGYPPFPSSWWRRWSRASPSCRTGGAASRLPRERPWWSRSPARADTSQGSCTTRNRRWVARLPASAASRDSAASSSPLWSAKPNSSSALSGSPDRFASEVEHRRALGPGSATQLRDVPRHRIVKRQAARLREASDDGSDHRLGQGTHAESRLGSHRLAGSRVRHSPVRGRDLSFAEDPDRRAGHRMPRSMLSKQHRELALVHTTMVMRCFACARHGATVMDSRVRNLTGHPALVLDGSLRQSGQVAAHRRRYRQEVRT